MDKNHMMDKIRKMDKNHEMDKIHEMDKNHQMDKFHLLVRDKKLGPPGSKLSEMNLIPIPIKDSPTKKSTIQMVSQDTKLEPTRLQNESPM